MNGHSAREVANLLGIDEGQLRGWVRAGFLEPARGSRGELRFSFEDLVLLRTAQGLVEAGISSRRVRSALRKLRGQLPEGRSLRAVRIRADGDRLVVGDGASRFCAESGQVLFDFDAQDLARKVAPLHRSAARESAHDWYEQGCDLEESAPQGAVEAYAAALRLEPDHVEARLNLGRLLHEAGNARAAAEHYRHALRVRPADPTALFNLGVALGDLGETDEAMASYRRALAVDPQYADAHYNLSRLHERRGEGAAALRHLRTYRQLTRGRQPAD